jgi:Phosphate-induced protein 1 conserved region
MKYKTLAAGLCAASLAMAQVPSRIAATTNARPAGGLNPAASGILYHGGPVLGAVPGHPVHLFYIFYGNWAGTDPGGPAIMTDFAQNLGGSPYWNILSTYVEPNTGTTIQNALILRNAVYDPGSQGTNLNDHTLQLVVQKWIGNGAFTANPNAVYHVLTSSEVNETSGFCSSYCGFHTHMSFNGVDIKYSFIGNPVHCTNYGGVADCQGDSHNISQSPNNDPGVDAMISVIAHESEEATSDPDLNAWYFSDGEEDADRCAYTYGTTHPAGNGSDYNVTLGGRNYLIQQNWIGPGGAGGTAAETCALSYP